MNILNNTKYLSLHIYPFNGKMRRISNRCLYSILATPFYDIHYHRFASKTVINYHS